MKKDKIITIRVSEKEKKKLIEKSEVAKLSLSEYLIKQGLDKEIVIVDGLNEVVTELRRIGNNINQLTYLANSGRIYTVDLSDALNKPFVSSEESNPDASNASELKVKNPTLIVFEGGRINEYVEGFDSVKNYLS